MARVFAPQQTESHLRTRANENIYKNQIDKSRSMKLKVQRIFGVSMYIRIHTNSKRRTGIWYHLSTREADRVALLSTLDPLKSF